MNKIKILHLVPTFGIGGLEHGVAKLANGLSPDQFKIDILSLYKFSGKQFSIPPQTKLIKFNLSNDSSRILKLIKLITIIRKGHYQIVHTHNWPTMIYGILAAKLASVPIIIHGEHNVKSKSGKSLFFQKIIARSPNHFTAICSPLSTWMQKNWCIPQEKISFIPNGIDVNRFYPKSTKSNNNKFIIGSVSRLEEAKNFPCIIKAFSIFVKQNPEIEAQLLIVGDGSKKSALEELVDEIGLSDKVIFTGETKHPEDFYRKMDVYINSTSFWEGMSNTILEAMACGLPIIASDIIANKSWLTKNENALFFKTENHSDLANKMIFLYTNIKLRMKMKEQNPLRIRKEFTIDLFIDRNKYLYLHLLKQKGV